MCPLTLLRACEKVGTPQVCLPKDIGYEPSASVFSHHACSLLT
ncbi:hypothetical protein LEMLEM_LOCUS12834 [Lemmus lemmus]